MLSGFSGVFRVYEVVCGVLEELYGVLSWQLAFLGLGAVVLKFRCSGRCLQGRALQGPLADTS